MPFYDVSLRLPDVSQTTPRRLPGDSQTAPRRLPDGSQTTPRRLPDDWEANLEPALPQAPVPAGNLIQYIVLYNSPVAREEQSVLAVTNRTVLHPKLLRPPPNTIIFKWKIDRIKWSAIQSLRRAQNAYRPLMRS